MFEFFAYFACFAGILCFSARIIPFFIDELRKRGRKVFSQIELPVIYEDVKLDVGYRIDVLVDDCVIVELKAVDKILPIHEAQLLSYLKLSSKKVGLIINFNVKYLKQGIKRMVNNL